ncbi:MAG TPA: GAF domain-containing sensor histidine kinase [Anaerolineae bacterium]
MSPQNLLRAANELLLSVHQLASFESSRLLWRELVPWLANKTNALGAGAGYDVGPAISDEAGAAAVTPLLSGRDILTTTSGHLDEQSLDWLAAPADEASAPLSAGFVIVQGAATRNLHLTLADDVGRPIARVAIAFSADRSVPNEHCTLLFASLQALMTTHAASVELQKTRTRLDRFQHLYEVGQVITSSLDLDQVLRLSTSRVAEVLRAEAGTLMLIDETRQELVFKIPAGPAEQMLLEKRMPLNKGAAGWVATHGRPLIIEDVKKDGRFYDAMDRLTGYRTRSILAVPLQVTGRTIGVVEVINKLGGTGFTEDDLQWLSILAPLIAIAIDNARLFARERQRVAELAAANTVATAANETLELSVMLRAALLTTMNVLHADSGEIGLLSPDTGQIEFQVSEGATDENVRRVDCASEDELSYWILESGRPLVLPDVANERRARGLKSVYADVRAYAGVPLIGWDRVTGVMAVMSRGEDVFDEAQIPLLSTIGRQIGMALENARLYVALREERDRIIAAEETVRHELARNLHDGPAQIMAALILNIDMARRQLTAGPDKVATELNFLESLAREANQEVRDLLFNLRPLSLEAHGLVAALSQLVERIQDHASYQVHLEVLPLPADTMDRKVAGTLFVIVQEALANIHKHAQAHNVWVRMGAADQVLWIDIADDGVGFDVGDVDANYARLNSFGLLNMRERARLIEGTTRIESPRPGAADGAVVRVEVPLSRARASEPQR